MEQCFIFSKKPKLHAGAVFGESCDRFPEDDRIIASRFEQLYGLGQLAQVKHRHRCRVQAL